MSKYKQLNDGEGGINNQAILRFDGAVIPFAPGNRDYQEYLEWVAQGNEPEPADPITE